MEELSWMRPQQIELEGNVLSVLQLASKKSLLPLIVDDDLYDQLFGVYIGRYDQVIAELKDVIEFLGIEDSKVVIEHVINENFYCELYLNGVKTPNKYTLGSLALFLPILKPKIEVNEALVSRIEMDEEELMRNIESNLGILISDIHIPEKRYNLEIDEKHLIRMLYHDSFRILERDEDGDYTYYKHVFKDSRGRLTLDIFSRGFDLPDRVIKAFERKKDLTLDELKHPNSSKYIPFIDMVRSSGAEVRKPYFHNDTALNDGEVELGGSVFTISIEISKNGESIRRILHPGIGLPLMLELGETYIKIPKGINMNDNSMYS